MSSCKYPLRTHGYYEYPSNVDIVRSILRQTDRKHLEEGLMGYLAEEGLNEYNQYWKIKKTVRSALEGNQKALNQLKGLEHNNLREIVIEAVGHGHVVKFILEEPWHYEIFKDPERPSTYPFQHKHSVWYRQQEDEAWFTEEVTEKIVNNQTDWSSHYNQKSVFNSGKLSPGSTHHKDQHIRDVEVKKDMKKEATYWSYHPEIKGEIPAAGTLRWQGDFLDNSVLEAYLPREMIEIGTDSECINSLQEIHEIYGSPLNFLENLGDVMETRVVKAPVDIDHIVGAWPRKDFDDKYFLNLKEFHSFLYSKYPGAVPANPKCLDQDLSKKGSSHSEEELKKLREELQITKQVEKLLEKARRVLIDVREISAMIRGISIHHLSEEERLRKAIQELEKYNKSIREVRELLEEEFNKEIEWKEVDSFEVFYKTLKEKKLNRLIKEAQNELEEIRAEAYQKTKANEINDHAYQKFNKYMIKELSRIPLIVLSKGEISNNFNRMMKES